MNATIPPGVILTNISCQTLAVTNVTNVPTSGTPAIRTDVVVSGGMVITLAVAFALSVLIV
jgi:hypothetical protein